MQTLSSSGMLCQRLTRLYVVCARGRARGVRRARSAQCRARAAPCCRVEGAMLRTPGIIIILAAVVQYVYGRPTPPVRVTIDCGSHEKDGHHKAGGRARLGAGFDMDSFCELIHAAIPQVIQDGRFVQRQPQDMDQAGFGDTLAPISAPPPEGFIPNFSLPKFRVPKLKIPTFNVPKLTTQEDNLFQAPRLASAKPSGLFPTLKATVEEESSAERMEKFKKGVQKMLHVVKVLGQIDQYLSERTRILVDKLARTFAD